MPAAVTDKLRKGYQTFSTTLSAQKNSGASTMSLSSATGLPTTTALDFVVGRVDANGDASPSTKAVYKGTLSGTTVSNLTLVEGTDQTHAAGTVVEVLLTASMWNDMIDHNLVEHNQDGTHGAITSTNATLTTPKVVTSINDTNGNESIKVTATASAVNEVTVSNAATGNMPSLSATGDNTNVDLYLKGKGTGSGRHAGVYDGWVAADETWTYASATTFTCSSNMAAILQVGTRIKLTQTTAKYFIVTGVSGTTITVTGAGDYTLANAAITSPFYSHEANPDDFPVKMRGANMYGVTTSAVSGTPPAITAGHYYIQAGSTVGTFSSNALDITFPTAFPNGLLTVITTNGDHGSGAAISTSNANNSASGFRAQSATNGVQRVNWIAVGW